MKITNVYFDTEFTELSLRGKLISIGMITDDGSAFYAEFDDFDKNSCSEWVKENVINNLCYNGNEEIDDRFVKSDNDIIMYDNSYKIKLCIIKWLEKIKEKTKCNYIQFVSDVCHYDFVFLIDLFGTAFDLPDYVSPACYDINQDIANKRFVYKSMRAAFDESRESILQEKRIEVKGIKHNALYDAKVIKELYHLYY